MDGGGGNKDTVVAPEVPAGGLVGQTIFGDQTDGPLLDAARVLAVGPSQVGEVAGEATATVEAAMAGERDHHLDGAGIAEIMEGSRAHRLATGTVATARAASGRPIVAAPFEARLGQVFDTSDALADIRNIFPWTNHHLFS